MVALNEELDEIAEEPTARFGCGAAEGAMTFPPKNRRDPRSVAYCSDSYLPDSDFSRHYARNRNYSPSLGSVLRQEPKSRLSTGVANREFTDDDTQSNYGANEIIYCGYRYDPEGPGYYVRNRNYMPFLGRWVQRDPIGYQGGINVYEYVGGRAAVAVDPMGHDAIPLPKSIPQAVTEAIIAALLAAYLLYLARRAAKVKCARRNRESGCEFYDCDIGRPCGARGSGRSCQWATIISGILKGQRQCGCYGGGPNDED